MPTRSMKLREYWASDLSNSKNEIEREIHDLEKEYQNIKEETKAIRMRLNLREDE